MEQLRFALLGCGRVSQRYLEVFQNEIADVAKVVAVHDPAVARTPQFASALGAAIVPSVEALMSHRPDVVVILTESGYHGMHAREFLERGVHVLVEKPVALRPDEVLANMALAGSRGVQYAVVKQNRYNPATRALKAAMDGGRFGRIVEIGVRVHWCRPQSYYEDGWHGTWSLDGGVLAQQAIHHLDMMCWIGGPIEAVCAAGAARVNKLEAEDTAAAVLRFRSGALGTVEATTAARPRDFEASISVVGEKGVAKISGIALNEVETWEFVDSLPEDAQAKLIFSQAVPSGYGLGHGPYLRDLCANLRTGRAAPVPAEEGLKSLHLLHAIYSSMERGAWSTLADGPLSSRLGQARAVKIASAV
jgi:predicted dehydrogenase